jgi:23S rRNA pseudouridine1911/1915/1917 synthase
MAHQLDILFEDNHLLVLNKPAGLLTQPSGTEQDSLEKYAKEWIKSTYAKKWNVFLEAVHRLDKPASGVVVFGRTTKALSRLNESIRNQRTHKYYYAIVEGSPHENEGVLEHYMIHDNFRAQIVFKDHPEAKLARLSYRIIQKTLTTSFLEIELETGRYHQIRLQLSEVGCPIIGDQKYGSSTPFHPDQIALHHFRLQIPHPVNQELLTFEAPMPSSFSEFLS